MRIHALREGFHALKQVECRLRRERGTEVAQLLRAQFREEPVFAEVPPPRDVIVRRHRLGHEREVAVRPVEPSALNNHAAEGGSVPAQEFGGGVNHDVGPVFQRANQVRG